MRICNKIGAEFHPCDFDIAHRVPSRNTSDGRPKPVRLFVNLLGASPMKVLWQPVEKKTGSFVLIFGLRESLSLEHAAIYDHLSPRLQSYYLKPRK